MRARQRHLNPASAGAKLVFDSRYIAASDGAAVTTWADRSGNAYDASQATTAAKPTFKTAIQGGQPIVRFDGGDFLSGSNSFTTSDFSIVSVVKKTTTVQFAGILCGSKGSGNDYDSTGGYIFTAEDNLTNIVAFGTNNTFVYTSSAITAFSIALMTKGGASGFLYLNGVQAGTNGSMTTASDTCTNTYIGARYLSGAVSASFRFNGDIGFLSLLPSNLGGGLRKRLQSSLSYSFKIACS